MWSISKDLLCTNTKCILEDLLRVMDYTDGERERGGNGERESGNSILSARPDDFSLAKILIYAGILA